MSRSTHVRKNRPLAQSEERALKESFALEEKNISMLEGNLSLARERAEATKKLLASHQQELYILRRRITASKVIHSVAEKLLDEMKPLKECDYIAHDTEAPRISKLNKMVAQLNAIVDSTLLTSSESEEHYSDLYSQVDHKVCDVQASLTTWEQTITRHEDQIQSAKSRLEKLKKQYGPVSRFPDEILRSIFREAVTFCRKDELDPNIFQEEWKFRTQYRELVLSSVCYRWRTIAQEYGALWSHIPLPPSSSAGSTSLILHYASLANPVPLHLYIIYRPNMFRVLSQHLELVDAGRLCSSISLMTNYADITPFLLSLPSTCTLRLLTHARDGSLKTIQIPTSVTSHLEQIYLSDFQAVWLSSNVHLSRYESRISRIASMTHAIIPASASTLQVVRASGMMFEQSSTTTPLILTSVEQVQCSLTSFTSFLSTQFRFPVLQHLTIDDSSDISIEDWKDALGKLVKFPGYVACRSIKDDVLLLVQCLALITGMETLELEGDTVDGVLDIIFDGSYRTDFRANAPNVFKKLKLLVISSYHGDGLSIARFAFALSPPKIALRECTRLELHVQASIAKHTSLVP